MTTVAMKTYQQSGGHWISLAPRHTLDEVSRILELTDGNIRGVLKRYRWRDFILGTLQIELDWCAAQGLRLIPMIEDKTFDGTNPLPTAFEKLVLANDSKGYTAIRWDAVVRGQFLSLINRIYSTFGDHLAFEGVALQETAPGLSDAQMKGSGYTAVTYADMYVDIFQEAWNLSPGTVSRPAKRLFWHQNFAPGTPSVIDSVVSQVLAAGLDNVAFGGPDCWWLDQTLLTKVYTRYTKYAGLLPMFIGMSRDSYTQRLDSGAIAPMSDGYQFARTKLNAEQIFWMTGDWFDKALPVINAGWL